MLRDIATLTWTELTRPEREARVAAYLEKGYTRTRIAELMHTTKSAVIGLTHRMPGYEGTGITPTDWVTTERVERAREMAQNGHNWTEIVDALKALPGDPMPMLKSVANRLRHFGIQAKGVYAGRGWRARQSMPDAAPRPPKPAAPRFVRVAPEPAPPAPLPVVSRGPCQFPLWGDNERPTHRYCEAPSVVGSYCEAHGRRCYDGWRPRGGGFQFGWTPGVAAE